MPRQAETLVYLPLSLRDSLPATGAIVRSPEKGSNALYRILGTRSISGSKKILVRLQPVPRSERAGIGATAHDWPRHDKPGRPSQPEAVREHQPIITPAQRARAARARAVELLADDRDEERTIPTVRLKNQTVIQSEWRDPADKNPHRRTPRVISGHRSYDAVEYFVNLGTFNRRQASAARRIRDQFDRAGGVRVGYDRMQNVGGGFGPSAGLSEQQRAAIQAFEAAREAVGQTQWVFVSLAILEEKRLVEIAARMGMQAYQVQPRLLAALDALADHYHVLDEQRRRERDRV